MSHQRRSDPPPTVQSWLRWGIDHETEPATDDLDVLLRRAALEVLEWLSFVRIELTEALDGNSATRVRRIIGQVEPIKLRYPRPSFLFVGSLATTDFLRPCSEEDLDDPMDFDGLSRDEEFAIRAERNRLHERGETGNRTRLLALLTPSIEAHNREEIVKEVGEYLAIRIGAAYYCYFDTQHFSAEYAERKQRIQKSTEISRKV